MCTGGGGGQFSPHIFFQGPRLIFPPAIAANTRVKDPPPNNYTHTHTCLCSRKEEEEASQARFQISLGVTQFFSRTPPFEVSALAKQDPFCMSSPCAYHQSRRHILHYTHKRTHESVVTYYHYTLPTADTHTGTVNGPKKKKKPGL